MLCSRLLGRLTREWFALTGDGDDLSPLSKDYVIGFVEAEGTLTSNISKTGKKYLQFSISQADECLIQKVEKSLPVDGGCVVGYESRCGGKKVWRYSTCRKRDIARLIRFFDGEFESENKCSQLEEWREVFKVWNGRGKTVELKEKV